MSSVKWFTVGPSICLSIASRRTAKIGSLKGEAFIKAYTLVELRVCEVLAQHLAAATIISINNPNVVICWTG